MRYIHHWILRNQPCFCCRTSSAKAFWIFRSGLELRISSSWGRVLGSRHLSITLTYLSGKELNRWVNLLAFIVSRSEWRAILWKIHRFAWKNNLGSEMRKIFDNDLRYNIQDTLLYSSNVLLRCRFSNPGLIWPFYLVFKKITRRFFCLPRCVRLLHFRNKRSLKLIFTSSDWLNFPK